MPIYRFDCRVFGPNAMLIFLERVVETSSRAPQASLLSVTFSIV